VSADEDRDRQARRSRAARRAAQRRHPASGRTQHAELRSIPSQPDHHLPSPAANTTQGDQMSDQRANPEPATVLAKLEHDLGYPVSPLVRQVVTDATATPPATFAEAVRTPDIQPSLNKQLPSAWELAAREFDDPAEPPDL
jgi:hypothetical protein